MVIQQYQDPRVGKYLKYGYWYQAHRGQVHNLERNVLLILVAIIWALLAYFVYGFILSQSQYNQVLEDLTAERVNVLALQQARAPRPIEIGPVAVLPGENQTRADFMAVAENANPHWYLEIDYNFIWTGGQTTSETTLILPQSNAVLSSRGVTVNSLPMAADLRLLATRWQRLRTNAAKERAAAVKAGIVIASPVARNDSGGAVSAAYTVKNQTIYNWLTPRFVVVLSHGGAPAALGVNEIPELASGSDAELEYRWRQSLPTGLSAEVYPALNPFDPASYHLPAGGDYAF